VILHAYRMSRHYTAKPCCFPLPPLVHLFLRPRYFFFFHDPPPTEIYTLSLHDALPISVDAAPDFVEITLHIPAIGQPIEGVGRRSEEHTSELQSHLNLVCRLLLEKKKIMRII